MTREVQWEPEGRRDARSEHCRQILAGKIESLTFLDALDLHNLQLGDDITIELLKRVASVQRIVGLDLGWDALQGRALSALAATELAGRIEKLFLSGNEFGDEGVVRLCEHSFPSLRELNLAYCGIGDRGAETLAGARLPALRVLRLRRNAIADNGALAIAESPTLRGQLETLDLDYNDDITRKGAKALRGAFGSALVE